MNIGAINQIGAVNAASGVENAGAADLRGLKGITGSLTGESGKKAGTVFESFLNSAMENIRTTNNYLSAAENEELRWALGETDNTHDLTIALQKASTALQYTIAVRDKMLESYKEIMQMQI